NATSIDRLVANAPAGELHSGQGHVLTRGSSNLWKLEAEIHAMKGHIEEGHHSGETLAAQKIPDVRIDAFRHAIVIVVVVLQLHVVHGKSLGLQQLPRTPHI